MYRGLSYMPHERKMRLFTWSEDGERITTDVGYHPYFYYETNNKRLQSATSLYGTKLRQIVCRSEKERRDKIKDMGIDRIFENITPYQQFLIDQYWERNEDEEFNKYPLKNWFFDIEVYSPDEFPKPEDAKFPINIITIYDTIEKHYYSWGLGPYVPETDDVTYVNCDNEKDLLWNFLNFYRKDPPDILSGWNSETFDIPYVINRLDNIFGEDVRNMISPMNEELRRPVYARQFMGSFGREQTKYIVEGISMLDYLDIYKTFSVGQRDSYKLDSIGEYEGVGRKINTNNTNLATLAEKDWKTFVDYNIQDVTLLAKLDEKLQFLGLVRMFSYVGLTPFNAALGTISTVNGRAIIQARKGDDPRVIPTFIKDTSRTEKYEGAYVGEPQRGFKENIISFDANSLYPSTMITLNLSPETKFGSITFTDDTHVHVKSVNNEDFKFTKPNFIKWAQKNKIAITKARKLFFQEPVGIFPAISKHFYNIRKEKKQLMYKLKKELTHLKNTVDNITDKEERKIAEKRLQELPVKINQAHIYQLTLKILINRIYGYFGNKHSQMGDGDIARSITLTGQEVIKQSNVILRNYIIENTDLTEEDLNKDNPVLYNDTDSSYVTITPLLKHLNIPLYIEAHSPATNNIVVKPEVYDLVQDIEDYLNVHIEQWARKSLNTIRPEFVFKRESICDKGMFLQKKRYVLHKLDDEGDPCNTFKYTGVEVVRTTMPDPVKPHVKGIIENMIMTGDESKTNEMFENVYKLYSSLPIEDIAFVMGIKDYDKYAIKANSFSIGKGTPIHVKSSIFYNELLEEFNLTSVHEKIGSGDKVRYFYVQQPNKYGCNSLAFKYNLPEEFKHLFLIDHEKMFEKTIFKVIERFYESVKWKPYKPGEAYQTDLFDFFSISR